MSTVYQRAINWIVGDDTGLSSEAIWAHMMCASEEEHRRSNYPSDPADLGRCLRLLELIPEWRGRIQEMRIYSPGWAGLCERWDDIVAMMDEEVGIDWSKNKGGAVRTYMAMKLAIADGYRKNPKYSCTFNADGTLSSWGKKKGGASGVSLGDGIEMRFGE